MRTLLVGLVLASGCGLVSHRPPSDYFLTSSMPPALRAPIQAGLARAFADLRLGEAPRGDVLVVNYGACADPDFAGQIEPGPPNATTLCAGAWGGEALTPLARAQRILALFHAVGHALDADHGGSADVMAPAPADALVQALLRDEDRFRYTDADMRNICAHANIPSCSK